jgi:hypothetical protein
MKILQIRKNDFEVETFVANNITHISCYNGVNNDVSIYFGYNEIHRQIKTKDKQETSKLYNALMDAWLTDIADNHIFIINMKQVDKDFVFASFEKHNALETDKLMMKSSKKYNVNLYYDTMYQVEVEAESEEEAVEKAREIANDESNEFAKEELLSGLSEEGHDVIEVK